MTPTRLRECLALLHWTQRGLAAALGIHETRVRRWARGMIAVPEPVAEWLERLAGVHVQHPLPAGWECDRQIRPDDDVAHLHAPVMQKGKLQA